MRLVTPCGGSVSRWSAEIGILTFAEPVSALLASVSVMTRSYTFVGRWHVLVETEYQLQSIINGPHRVAVKSHHRLTEATDVECGKLLHQDLRAITQNLNYGSHGGVSRSRRSGRDQHH